MGDPALLAAYDGIRDLTIAYGDAGVVPYFTDARIVDTVGLNDNVIARERDLAGWCNTSSTASPTSSSF